MILFRTRVTRNILTFFFSFLCLFVFCQENELQKELIGGKECNDKIYGLNPALYNGELYTSFYNYNILGSQFFIDNNFVKGDVIIRGVTYKDLDLNYDVYNQALLLRYNTTENSYNIIELSKAWLQRFSLGNNHFVVRFLPDNSQKIYQVIGNDSVAIMNYWTKKIDVEDSFIEFSGLTFKTFKEANVLINNSLFQFKNNKSFIKSFPGKFHEQIRNYIKQHKINVKKASDSTLEELISYCSKIIV